MKDMNFVPFNYQLQFLT